MAAGWYVLHTYAGSENRIEKKIQLMVDSGELDKAIVQDVRIPFIEEVVVRDGKKRTQTRKSLPSYMLVQLDLPNETLGWRLVCSKLRSIDGVTGFVCTPKDKKPQPLSQEETRAIFQGSGESKGERAPRARQSFARGEQVKIIDGPFESFTGTIEDVNQERAKLKVSVQIFGRNTPVEVDLLQVEKL
jgi:transcriptional antiterminator NusG